MERRQVLASLVAGVWMGLSGCSGLSGGAPSAPDPATDPVTLLPPTPTDMTEIRRSSFQPADTGAEVGAFAAFETESGDNYETEVLRWPDEDSAVEGVSVYTSDERLWSVYVTNGVFSWAGASGAGTEATVLDVLGTAEGLTRAYAERTDALDGED